MNCFYANIQVAAQIAELRGSGTGLCVHAAWVEAFLLDRGLPPSIGFPTLEVPQAPRHTNVWTQASAQFTLLLIFASGGLAHPSISSSLKTDYGIPAVVLFYSVTKCI